MSDGIERLTGDLKNAAGEVVAPRIAVELDTLGEIHVAVFQIARSLVKENEAVVLEVASGRVIELFLLRDSFQPDGSVRAAVVKDSGRRGYGLGLELSTD
ncbi:hypothetical protein [Paludisphaera rhizosphaerae]|uniref:hypothetical protein n=1 Tax=Paludisphaera rhizosphaerae TaxID=2711216 RepID=UPI0013ED6257|nr:hypothetical protein [Paludisphaera rhizosphaerae]